MYLDIQLPGVILNDQLSIDVQNLVKVFPARKRSGREDKRAVDDVSFQVRKGEIFGLLGPNGAGKTTTIKMLFTLLLPTSGDALVLGKSILKDDKDIRKRINLVSGGERGLYYRLTGRQNLRFFSELYGIPPATRETRIDGLLQLVGLSEAADVRVEDYSRGMKQRMHIARALVNDPDILFLDEPTIGLDPEISRDIRALVKKMAENGKTILLTTHYMFEAEELCDRIAVINHGRIVATGTSHELKNLVKSSTVIEVVTVLDPQDCFESLKKTQGVLNIVSERFSGRHLNRFQVEKREELFDIINDTLRPYRVVRAGYDEPTLEDTYISLVSHNEL